MLEPQIAAVTPMLCPQCGHDIDDDADQFCVTCGVSLWHDCRQCGQRVFAAARFCPGCRADLENQRAFNDYLQLGKDHLDEARRLPPSADAVRHLEQARLALGKALTCIDAAEARALADEVNNLTVSVAWQAGEVAAAATRLTEASYCYGQILEASPGHAKGAACLKKVLSYRSELITKAQTLFAEGRRKNALALLRTGVEQFEDDDELADLWAQYHESSVQLQELRDRIPVLAGENRWCEVAQVVAELSQSGVPMKGLDAEAAKAQQRLAAVDPLVAAAKRSLDAGNTAQALAKANQALQHVADHAEAMEIVELARSRDRVAQRRAASRRRHRRVLASLAGLACLATVSGLAYVGLREKRAVDQAEQQIKGGDYKAGMQTLRMLPHRFIYASDASYLENLASIRQYTSERVPPKPVVLETCRKQFIRLLGASQGWRTRARTDLADTIERVPPDAADALARSVAIGRVLKELQVAEPTTLAAGLIAKAEQRTGGRAALDASDTACVLQILEWDRTAAGKVVELACPEGQPLEPGLGAVRAWAAAGTPYASALSAAVVQVADREMRRGGFEQAKLALDTAVRIDPKCDNASLWDRHFQERLERGDKNGAEVLLSWMVWEEQDAAKLSRAVELGKKLKTKFAPEAVKLPPQISVQVSQAEFNKRIDQAEQAMKRGEYTQALMLLTDARQQYPEVYKVHAQAQQLFADATSAVGLERARQLLAAGDLDAAEKAVDEALQASVDDPGAKALREEIRAGLAARLAKEGRSLLDAQDWDKAFEHLQSAVVRFPKDSLLVALAEEASVQRHRTAAKRAIDRGELAAAVDEIIAARELLFASANASWTSVLRQPIDVLAAEVRDAACDQAQKLAEQRQYEEALRSLAIAVKLSSTDAKVVNLRAQIEMLSTGAKTADLSGTWRAPPGLRTPRGMQLAPDITEFELTDRGNQVTVKAVQAPAMVQDFTGEFRRFGTRLEGTFQFVLQDQTTVRAAVTANVKKDPRSLAVEWKEIRYTDVRKGEFELEGYVDWTRVE